MRCSIEIDGGTVLPLRGSFLGLGRFGICVIVILLAIVLR